jgi:hypothetical protein
MILIDVMMLLSTYEVEKSQLVCGLWNKTITQSRDNHLRQKRYFNDVFLSNDIITEKYKYYSSPRFAYLTDVVTLAAVFVTVEGLNDVKKRVYIRSVSSKRITDLAYGIIGTVRYHRLYSGKWADKRNLATKAFTYTCQEWRPHNFRTEKIQVKTKIMRSLLERVFYPAYCSQWDRQICFSQCATLRKKEKWDFSGCFYYYF